MGNDNKKKAWGVKSGTIFMAFSYILTTIFVFGYQMIAIRLLKPTQYGLVSILYSSVVLVSLFMGQTFEVTLSKFISEYEAHGHNYLSLIKKTWLWQFLSLSIFVVLAIFIKNIIVHNLFPEAPFYFAFLISCVCCYGIETGLRGVMRGLRDFGYFGTLVISLNFFRILYLIIFVGVMKQGLFGAGLSILLAPITNIFISMLWYRKHWGDFECYQQEKQDLLTFRELGPFIFPTMAMFGLGAYFYNTGPMFIKIFGGQSANETAGLFLIAVMISRLPLQLSEALSVNLLPNMSHSCARGDWRGIINYITRSYQLFIPISIIAISGIYLFGPNIIRIIYPEFSYDRLGLSILMAGTSVIMLVASENQFLLAQKKMTNVVFSWLAGCVVLTLFVYFMPGDILIRLQSGYLFGGISVWVCLLFFTNSALNEMKVIDRLNIRKNLL